MNNQITIEDILVPDEGFKRVPRWINIDKHSNTYWCPYCNKAREFKKDEATGARKCVCGISTRDFHIRKINKLFYGGR